MANNAVVQLHHVLQQAVGSDNAVLNALIANGGLNIDAPENTLFLSSDAGLADATGTVRHASNHAAIDKVQNAILDDFGKQPTQFGMTNRQLMEALPGDLTAEQVAARNAIFQDAKALAENLRDVTNKAIVNGELPLLGITDADIARIFGSAADGYAAFETAGSSNSLAAHDGILALDLDCNGKIDSIRETISVHFNSGNFVDCVTQDFPKNPLQVRGHRIVLCNESLRKALLNGGRHSSIRTSPEAFDVAGVWYGAIIEIAEQGISK